jgi:hypothetical protein
VSVILIDFLPDRLFPCSGYRLDGSTVGWAVAREVFSPLDVHICCSTNAVSWKPTCSTGSSEGKSGAKWKSEGRGSSLEVDRKS